MPDTAPAPASRTPLHVRLLWLPQALPGTLFAALDVLRAAAQVAAVQRPGSSRELSWQIVSANGRSMPSAFWSPSGRRAPSRPPEQSLLLIPAIAADNAPQLGDTVARATAALRLVERHAQAGGWVAACSSGMVMLAELGLLDGHRVSAPWVYQSWMARRYPRCDFGANEEMGGAERLFTCVAPASMTEFMLRMLGHLHDPDLAQACSQVLLHQPLRQQLTPNLVESQWITRTADSPVYRAMQWLQANVDKPYRLAPVADAAATSERTLLRHFRQVTGMTPLDYLHHLRIERAKMLLEVTLHGVPGIAEACGYSDTASFRRLFHRETGMSLSEYRSRYTLRSRRSHWRVERQSPPGA
ncbi:GlxA family transcriptional regulator [Piscinibacter sp. HJYY11]|uniref:GlxA family transcriptional regulator n=1 Tax=Piscinibacter sp. HJYY11 TaxID=2801333 RepID=UPI00191E3C68|nr:helix-turn-helix domain-containing protein [Piscinibacter sp. HJYY11]MBL0730398.1 helix-turn-helix domain-containing protein [Piscinibacter sp. HJYY11]